MEGPGEILARAARADLQSQMTLESGAIQPASVRGRRPRITLVA